MNQVVTVVLQCLYSGAIFSSLCAALVVPPLAWFGVRALSSLIAAMHDDRRWQANVAAAAAVLPGALFLILVSYGIAEGWNSPCLHLTAGRILYGLLTAFIAGAMARSLLRAYGRHKELQAILVDAVPARGRAAVIADEVAIPLFEVQDEDEIVVMLAGAPRPGAYVSTAALRQFDDAELRAALFHERAHMERGDHHIAPWLYFLTDLLPLPAKDLIGIYRWSREFCADSAAIAHVQRTDLASALLRIARGSMPSSLRAVVAFAERDAIYGRLDVLLRPQCERPPNLVRRALVTAAIAAIFAFGVAIPSISAALSYCQTLRPLS